MVAGGLGQRTCPRSRCAARQSRASAASRLRGRPGAAAAARRRARAAMLGARLSPPLHNGASPAPPRRGELPDLAAPGRRGRGGSPGPAHSPLLLPPHHPSAAWESVLGGLLGAPRSLGCGTAPPPPPTAWEGAAGPPTSSHFPSSHVSHPTPLFQTSVPTPSPPL